VANLHFVVGLFSQGETQLVQPSGRLIKEHLSGTGWRIDRNLGLVRIVSVLNWGELILSLYFDDSKLSLTDVSKEVLYKEFKLDGVRS
jgi:hypothetical protein